jgi:hypothetical protein
MYLKQVLLNGKVLWEKDVVGNKGWEHVVVPMVLSEGENDLELRIYKKSNAYMPISVWLDDVKLEAPEELIVL